MKKKLFLLFFTLSGCLILFPDLIMFCRFYVCKITKKCVFFIVKKCKYVIGEIYLVVYLAPETCEAAYRAAVKPFVDPVC